MTVNYVKKDKENNSILRTIKNVKSITESYKGYEIVYRIKNKKKEIELKIICIDETLVNIVPGNKIC